MSEDILNEREKTHGEYCDVAKTAQSIQLDMRCSKNWFHLNSMQRESLEMIATKISRILNGDPNKKDHWDDISGYALLISRELKDE